MISSFSLFEIISVVISHTKIFLWIAESVDDTACVNPNSIKILLAKDLSTFFFIKGKQISCANFAKLDS